MVNYDRKQIPYFQKETLNKFMLDRIVIGFYLLHYMMYNLGYYKTYYLLYNVCSLCYLYNKLFYIKNIFVLIVVRKKTRWLLVKICYSCWRGVMTEYNSIIEIRLGCLLVGPGSTGGVPYEGLF